MSVLAAIHRELDDAALTGYKHIVHIRLTTDAIPGSVTSTPVTPERARVLGRLLAVPGDAVIADPASSEVLLEILMHPKDFYTMLTETDVYNMMTPGCVMGLPVVQ